MIKEFNQIMHEYIDLSDRDTRKTIIGLDEADQNQLLAALTSKLYDKIVEKVDDIDFGTIPRSRGDITKVENYDSLMECIDILRNIIVEYKEKTTPIDVVSTAVENVKQRTKLFTKAYVMNVEMPIVLYNTIVLAIVSSISFLISGCIEYIKDPGAETYNIALDRVGYNRTAQNLLFENLAMFNASCKNGDLDVALNDVIRNNRRIAAENATAIDTSMDGDASDDRIPIQDKSLVNEGMGPVALVGRALVSICKLIIPMIQNLVYYFYHSSQNISDYFAIQAELVQMNAYKVQYSTTMADDQRKSVYNKQMKIADKLRKISNTFAVDYNKSKVSAASLAAEERKKFTTDELGMAPQPSMTQSSLF